MAEDVPFDKSFDLIANQSKEVAPQVRAVAADNAGPFTFKGTISYIIGRGNVALLDPGPYDDAHIAALVTFDAAISSVIVRGNVTLLDPGTDADAHLASVLDAVRGESLPRLFV